MQIYLMELTAVDANGNPRELRYSTGSDYMTGPDETPANAVYEGRIVSPGTFSWNCWEQGATRGTSSRTFGVVKLANGDGALDFIKDLGVDGQNLVIKVGDDQGPYAAFAPLFTGKCRRADVLWSEVDVNILDYQSDVADMSLQIVKYAGTNSGAAGVEGVSSDLEGKPKPKLRGTASNFSPPCVNTSTLIYQVDDGTALLPMTIVNVWDMRVAITAGVKRTTLSALETTAPGAGKYDWYAGPEGWYFRLGSIPAGTVTATMSEGAVTDRTAVQISTRLLQGEGGVPAALIDMASVGTVDKAKSYEVGFWSDVVETTIGQVTDMVLDSINACLTNTRTGIFRFGYLNDPALSPPGVVIEEWQLKDPENFSIVGTNDPGTGLRISDPINGQIGTQRYSSDQDSTIGLPVWRILLCYDHNLCVMDASQLAGASLADVNYVGQEYRQVIASNPAVLNQHVKAPEFTVNTQIRSLTDATTEAAVQLALRSVNRVIVTIPVDPSVAQGISLLTPISLTLGRFGWDDGKPLLVIGMTEDYGDDPTSPALITLNCWG